VKFATSIGADSLAALRAKPHDELLKAAMGSQPWFSPNIDGYVLTEDVYATYAAGKQAHVPLLAGWNADEVRAGVVLARQKATAQSFTEDVRKRFGGQADAILKAYPAATDAEALESAATLASDTFIGHGTWKWIEMHLKTGRSPVYRYWFDRKIPVAPDTKVNDQPATSKDVGARHAGEIEYVFGALDSKKDVPWAIEDRKLSDQITTYWANFAREGDPNGGGLPGWPRYFDEDGYKVLHLDTTVWDGKDGTRARYLALDKFVEGQRGQ
jgi:para-nitrobenzyl esterase